MSVANSDHKPIPHPKDRKFSSFREFYPFYLGEHRNVTCRRLHFVGTSLVLGITATAIATLRPGLLLAVPVAGYGFAWVGHFVFERNRPATFTYPLWSLMGDFVMYFEILSLKRKF
ncbi:hypothetical protein BC830DRAFT_1123917 [Chytriomyces sp. MP71]|nr:hypothetical protein BC830DRAFT_1123917 [Chytriomyces sp. MP71]